MKVLINTSILRFGGAVQGAVSFIRECKEISNNEYHIFIGPGVKNSINLNEYPSNFYFYQFNFGKIKLYKIPLLVRSLSRIEKEIEPDVIITTSGPSYWHSKKPHLMGFNLGLYIYTESPYIRQLNIYRKIRWYIRKTLHAYFFNRDGTAFFVQTDDVNVRVRKYLKTDKVYTVSNTYNDYFESPKRMTNKLPANVYKKNRILTVSAYYYHKNLEIIPLIIRELLSRGRNDFVFILTISNRDYNSIFGDEFLNEAITINEIKPEEVPSLYKECGFLFMPTLAECFSASYPEAMIMQKPIITTELSFARNICGNAAIYYEPKNALAAADAIERILDDPSLQEGLKKKGIQQLKKFNTPTERARQILMICEQLIND